MTSSQRDRGPKTKIHRPRTGFLKGPKLAALVRVLRLRKMYISRFNSVTCHSIYTFNGKVEDARWSTVERRPTLSTTNSRKAPVGYSKLDNIERSKHRWDFEPSGSITHCCDLLVSRNRNKKGLGSCHEPRRGPIHLRIPMVGHLQPRYQLARRTGRRITFQS